MDFRRADGINVTGTKDKRDLLAQVQELVAGARESELIAMIDAVKG